jgi:hypothetical protein
MDHGNNPLDQNCIGTYKHIKEVKILIHKLNALSINVEQYANTCQVMTHMIMDIWPLLLF